MPQEREREKQVKKKLPGRGIPAKESIEGSSIFMKLLHDGVFQRIVRGGWSAVVDLNLQAACLHTKHGDVLLKHPSPVKYRVSIWVSTWISIWVSIWVSSWKPQTGMGSISKDTLPKHSKSRSYSLQILQTVLELDSYLLISKLSSFSSNWLHSGLISSKLQVNFK